MSKLDQKCFVLKFLKLHFHSRDTLLDYVTPVGEAVHPDPLPAVEDSAVAVTLVELASVAATGQPLTIGTPGDAGQTVLIAVAHLGLVSISIMLCSH